VMMEIQLGTFDPRTYEAAEIAPLFVLPRHRTQARHARGVRLRGAAAFAGPSSTGQIQWSIAAAPSELPRRCRFVLSIRLASNAR
jgi:hypothetical protein